MKKSKGYVACQTTEDETCRTGEATPSVSKATLYASESGVTTRQRVFRDIAQILSVPFSSVPKIHLWL